MSVNFYLTIAKGGLIVALATGILAVLGYSLVTAAVASVALLLAVGAAVAVAYIDNTDESQSIKPREWE